VRRELRRYTADIQNINLGPRVTESKSSSGREGGRSLKTRVKTARKRSLSSTLWLERQLNDPYVAKAKREGFRSRAAYKLIEIDERYAFLKPGQKIVDLGAAPGGWSQVCVQKTSAETGKGRVIGIDLLDTEPLPGAEFKVMDFLAEDAPQQLMEWLGGKADVVLSDMAANATGHKKTDQLRIIGLVELAADFACEVLTEGGAFLAKVIQGGTEHELLARLKREFASVRHVKPQASRAGSAELYVLATGFRGTTKR
jgi:23S rRNA (uridine2552-2'-O)-methyltransferase